MCQAGRDDRVEDSADNLAEATRGEVGVGRVGPGHTRADENPPRAHTQWIGSPERGGAPKCGAGSEPGGSFGQFPTRVNFLQGPHPRGCSRSGRITPR